MRRGEARCGTIYRQNLTGKPKIQLQRVCKIISEKKIVEQRTLVGCYYMN